MTGLPERLVVLGGGSIGCELGQAFTRLGSRVSIVEAAPRLLAGEDPDAAGVVAAALRRDGMTVLTRAAVTAVRTDGSGRGAVVLDGGAQIAFDRLLVAVGRSPRTADVGLLRWQGSPAARGAMSPSTRTCGPRIGGSPCLP